MASVRDKFRTLTRQLLEKIGNEMPDKKFNPNNANRKVFFMKSTDGVFWFMLSILLAIILVYQNFGYKKPLPNPCDEKAAAEQTVS